jgi:hypothetical protein
LGQIILLVFTLYKLKHGENKGKKSDKGVNIHIVNDGNIAGGADYD